MQQWIKIIILALATTLGAEEAHLATHPSQVIDFKELISMGATFFGVLAAGMAGSPLAPKFKDE